MIIDLLHNLNFEILPPANEVSEGYVLQVSVCSRGVGEGVRGRWAEACMGGG